MSIYQSAPQWRAEEISTKIRLTFVMVEGTDPHDEQAREGAHFVCLKDKAAVVTGGEPREGINVSGGMYFS